MPSFMVERYLPAATPTALADAASLARAAGTALSAEGVAVRYLRSVFAPVDEWCFSLFSADSAATVRLAHVRMGIPFDRIVEVVTLDDDDL